MNKIICLLPVLLVYGIVGVDSLQCYVCENCASPTEADLKSCDDPVTTAPTQTTAAPAQTTAATAQTTSAPAQTTATPAQTTAAPAQTTATPAQTTAAPAQTTATPAQTTATPVLPTAVPLENTDPSARRFKRSVLSLANSTKTACNCKNKTSCNCDDTPSRISTYADYVCFKAVLKKDDVIVRGCAPAMLDSRAPCEMEDVIAVVNSCSTCDTDQCNSGFMTQFSLYMLAAVVSVMLFK